MGNDKKQVSGEALAFSGSLKKRPGNFFIGEISSIFGSRELESGLSFVDSAENVDKGVFQIALFAVKFDDGEAVSDHVAEDFSGFLGIGGGDADAASPFAGFDEFDFAVENGPVVHYFGPFRDLNVVEDSSGGVGAHFEGFGVAMVDDAASVDEEKGIAHLA